MPPDHETDHLRRAVALIERLSANNQEAIARCDAILEGRPFKPSSITFAEGEKPDATAGVAKDGEPAGPAARISFNSQTGEITSEHYSTRPPSAVTRFAEEGDAGVLAALGLKRTPLGELKLANGDRLPTHFFPPSLARVPLRGDTRPPSGMWADLLEPSLERLFRETGLDTAKIDELVALAVAERRGRVGFRDGTGDGRDSVVHRESIIE